MVMVREALHSYRGLGNPFGDHGPARAVRAGDPALTGADRQMAVRKSHGQHTLYSGYDLAENLRGSMSISGKPGMRKDLKPSSIELGESVINCQTQ
jgi:hypothetical protein